jgi:hypothetical protein
MFIVVSFVHMKPIDHIPSTSSPPFHPPQVLPPHSTYFTVLSFICNSKVSVCRGFSVYSCCFSFLNSSFKKGFTRWFCCCRGQPTVLSPVSSRQSRFSKSLCQFDV